MCKAKWLLTVLGVLVLVIVLTGCGGMDGATGPGVDTAAKPVKPPPPPPPPPMPTGQRIAFLRDNVIWTMNTDGSDQVAVGSGMHADWHRALAKMAVVRNYCIYTMEGNGTNAVPVTTQVSYGGAASYDQYPDWSPDGTKIAFTRGMVSDGIGSSIQILDLGSGNITQIYPDPTVDPREYTVPIYSPKWSPDGNFLVFYRGNGWALGVVNLVTGQVKDAFLADARFAEFNPVNGQELAFEGLAVNPRGAGLWLATFDPATMAVTPTVRLTTTAMQKPTWSPDGQRLAFQQIVPGGTNTYDILRLDRTGQNLTNLTATSRTRELGADWSPVLP